MVDGRSVVAPDLEQQRPGAVSHYGAGGFAVQAHVGATNAERLGDRMDTGLEADASTSGGEGVERGLDVVAGVQHPRATPFLVRRTRATIVDGAGVEGGQRAVMVRDATWLRG